MPTDAEAALAAPVGPEPGSADIGPIPVVPEARAIPGAGPVVPAVGSTVAGVGPAADPGAGPVVSGAGATVPRVGPTGPETGRVGPDAALAGDAPASEPPAEGGPATPTGDGEAVGPPAASGEAPAANGEDATTPAANGTATSAARDISTPAANGAGDDIPTPGRKRAGTGRNLPVALAVGAGLGAGAIVTLFTVKLAFLIYMTAAGGIALWELVRALAIRGIRVPLPPVAAGGVLAVALAYWQGERALVASFTVTAIAILGWRLLGGTAGYLRDVTAGIFALAYIPLMASFIVLMLAAPDGSHRVLLFLILAVCSDIGGYFAGILFGSHPMAPVISPRKTWEGLVGSVLACLLAGMIALPILLSGTVWQGFLLGAAAVAAATLGDLAESMIKRDLQIKDMGTVLPGHGGLMDRADSLLTTAPVIWLLLAVFVPVAS